MSREPTEIVVALHADGRTGVFISTDGDGRHAKWIVRRLIGSMHKTGKTTRGTDRDGNPVILPMAHITVPEWLATKMELV